MPASLIQGPEGKIEVRYHISSKASAPLAIILHPHPEHGGTMNNKVVYTMYKNFVDQGFHAVRFNFRGAGNSEGHFDFGEGELRDARVVLEWFKTQVPESKGIWIAGFSFGAWVALQLVQRIGPVNSFVCAGPPANVYDFSFMIPCSTPGIFIQGDKDTIVDAQAVEELASTVTKHSDNPLRCEVIKDADHFFIGKLDIFAQIMNTYLQEYIS